MVLKQFSGFKNLFVKMLKMLLGESIKTIKTTEVAYQMDDDLSGAARKINIKLTPNKRQFYRS